MGLLNKCLPKFQLYVPSQRGMDVLEIIKIAKNALIFVKSIDKMSEFNWELTPNLRYE